MKNSTCYQKFYLRLGLLMTERSRWAKRYPDIIYCWAYQDGFLHAIERILALRKSGYYSHQCNPVNAARTYEFHLRPAKVRAREYGEVAYIDGYVAGHLYFLGDDALRRLTPRYYVYG